MSALIGFTVVGTPAPQGSKRHVGRGILVESSKKVAPWRQDVAAAAQAAMPEDWAPIDAPVELRVTFLLRRPPSIPKRRTLPDRTPDLDKLVRATMDGLTTAGIWRDDARVVVINASKLYADTATGARIDVHEATT